MIDPNLVELEVAEAKFLEKYGWVRVPKPPGAENNPEVPQWWKDPRPEEGTVTRSYKEHRQDRAVELQKMRLVDQMRRG